MRSTLAMLLLSLASAIATPSKVVGAAEQPDAEGCVKHITGFTLGIINVDTKGTRFAGAVAGLPNPAAPGSKVSGITSDKGQLAQDFEFWLCDPPSVDAKSNDSQAVGQFRPSGSTGQRIAIGNIEKSKQPLILSQRGDPSTYTWILRYFYKGSTHAAEFAVPNNHTYKGGVGSYHISLASAGALGWHPHRGLQLNYVAPSKGPVKTKQYKLSLTP